MGGQRQLRRAGVVSAGTLALVLTSAPSPAAADQRDESECRDGDGLLSTVTGAVCDTTGAVTDTTTGLLDDTTGGATEDLTDGVKDATGAVTDTVRDATRPRDRGDGGSSASPPAGEGEQSGGSGPAGSGGSSDSSGSGGSSGSGQADADGARGGDSDAGGSEVRAAGSTSDATGGRPPRLQPLSPLVDLRSSTTPDDGATSSRPQLPEIAPSPTPSPEPTLSAEADDTQYVAPAAGGGASDRGEATPALMVLFALVAAGVVTGGHVAVARARVRSRQVD